MTLMMLTMIMNGSFGLVTVKRSVSRLYGGGHLWDMRLLILISSLSYGSIKAPQRVRGSQAPGLRKSYAIVIGSHLSIA